MARAYGSAAALAVTLASVLVTAAVPTPALTRDGWSDGYGDGTVSVPADRTRITVCDSRGGDGHYYRVIWHNDNPIDARAPFRKIAPRRGGCATDSSIWGRVWVFKLCHGQPSGIGRSIRWDHCNPPVWTRRRGWGIQE